MIRVVTKKMHEALSALIRRIDLEESAQVAYNQRQKMVLKASWMEETEESPELGEARISQCPTERF